MESKFKIVEEEEYIFAVSDEEIKKGDCHRFTCFDGDIIKKIIAYQPKGNVLELDLPLLPDVEDDLEKLYKKPNLDEDSKSATAFIDGHYYGFEDGYKAATKRYNEEDMYNLSAFVVDFIAGRKGDFIITTPKMIADKFIQSLEQPKWFVAEMKHTKSEVFRENDNVPYAVLKTTTINNKTYLVGTYLN